MAHAVNISLERCGFGAHVDRLLSITAILRLFIAVVCLKNNILLR